MPSMAHLKILYDWRGLPVEFLLQPKGVSSDTCRPRRARGSERARGLETLYARGRHPREGFAYHFPERVEDK